MLWGQKRHKAAQALEFRQGLKRLRLAEKLGVGLRKLVGEIVEVPREAIGRVSTLAKCGWE